MLSSVWVFVMPSIVVASFLTKNKLSSLMSILMCTKSCHALYIFRGHPAVSSF